MYTFYYILHISVPLFTILKICTGTPLCLPCMLIILMSNQGNQGYSGNQHNVIQGQRHDMEYRHTQQGT